MVTIGTMVSMTRSIKMSRKYTNKILEMLDDGLLNEEFLIQNLLMWMSEAEVAEFYDRTIAEIEEDEDVE